LGCASEGHDCRAESCTTVRGLKRFLDEQRRFDSAQNWCQSLEGMARLTTTQHLTATIRERPFHLASYIVPPTPAVESGSLASCALVVAVPESRWRLRTLLLLFIPLECSSKTS